MTSMVGGAKPQSKYHSLETRRLCVEPISTGIMDQKLTYDPCGRPLYKDTGYCVYHAEEKGVVPKPIKTQKNVIPNERRIELAIKRKAEKELRQKRSEERKARLAADVAGAPRRKRRAENERRRREAKRLNNAAKTIKKDTVIGEANLLQ